MSDTFGGEQLASCHQNRLSHSRAMALSAFSRSHDLRITRRLHTPSKQGWRDAG
jgi:hypothetical protein